MDGTAGIFEHAEVRARTERAMLLRIDEREVWVPLTQIIYDEELEDCIAVSDEAGESGPVILKAWIIEEKDLEELVSEWLR